MTSKPRCIFSTQAEPTPDSESLLPWNLSFEQCRQQLPYEDLQEVLCYQPTFTSLPFSLRARRSGYSPPVFHFGFLYNEDKLKLLCKTYPAMYSSEHCVLDIIECMMHAGYMRVSPECGMNGEEDIVKLIAIASNYWPWVEEDTMQKIRDFLVKDLGEPRWFIDPEYSYWKKGKFFNGRVPIVQYRRPWKFYHSVLRSESTDSWVKEVLSSIQTERP